MLVVIKEDMERNGVRLMMGTRGNEQVWWAHESHTEIGDHGTDDACIITYTANVGAYAPDVLRMDGMEGKPHEFKFVEVKRHRGLHLIYVCETELKFIDAITQEADQCGFDLSLPEMADLAGWEIEK